MLIRIKKLKGHSLSLSIKEACAALHLPYAPQSQFKSLSSLSSVIRKSESRLFMHYAPLQTPLFAFPDDHQWYVHPKTFTHIAKRTFINVLKRKAKETADKNTANLF